MTETQQDQGNDDDDKIKYKSSPHFDVRQGLGGGPHNANLTKHLYIEMVPFTIDDFVVEVERLYVHGAYRKCVSADVTMLMRVAGNAECHALDLGPRDAYGHATDSVWVLRTGIEVPYHFKGCRNADQKKKRIEKIRKEAQAEFDEKRQQLIADSLAVFNQGLKDTIDRRNTDCIANWVTVFTGERLNMDWFKKTIAVEDEALQEQLKKLQEESKKLKARIGGIHAGIRAMRNTGMLAYLEEDAWTGIEGQPLPDAVKTQLKQKLEAGEGFNFKPRKVMF